MNAVRTLALAVAIASLAGCASNKQAPTVNLATPASQLVANYTEAKKPELPNKRIIISSFGVEFQTRVKYSSTGGFGSTSSSTAVLNLAGVKPETMQAIADGAYANLVKDLKAAGYEVIDGADLEKNSDYQKLKGKASPSGDEITFSDEKGKTLTNKSHVYSPAGKVWYRPDSDEAGPRLGLSGMFSSIGRIPKKNYESDLGKAFDASVLKVTYVVGFGTASASTTSSAHSQKASAQIRLQGGGETRMAFRIPGKSLLPGFEANDRPRDGHAIVALSKDIVGEDSNFLAGDVVNSTSLNQRAGNALSGALSVLGAAAGVSRGGSGNSQEFTAPADDALYRAAVERHLSLAEGVLLARLKLGK